jgi:histidyl-tRNA synthetase
LENLALRTFKRIKGTQDILPDQTAHWQRVEEIIRRTMHLFNYRELRTPTFEATEIFARGIGQATDIVSKEMYTFLDRGKKSLTLKPEMTAPIIRAFIENNMQERLPLNKIYYIAALFRQENPQAGRLRQFNQFGAEAIGSQAAELDAEVIMLALQIYEKLAINKLKIVINSVGEPQSREQYKKALKIHIKPLLEKYCADCKKRFSTNPLRILDCKNESCINLNQKAPILLDHLSAECLEHFRLLQNILKDNHIEFEIDPYMVRGLDYYTRTVFEITSDELGSQDAICGGGRYDLLAEQLGGQPTAAVGFASGIERLLMVMQAQGLLKTQEQDERLDIFISPLGETASLLAIRWALRLRELGYKTERDYLKRSLKAQMREANRLHSKLVFLLGDNEIKNQEFTVKEMDTGVQNALPFAKVEAYLKKYFKS